MLEKKKVTSKASSRSGKELTPEEKVWFFDEIMDHSANLLYRLNLKTGTYDYASESCMNIIGITNIKLTSLGFEDAAEYVHKEDAERLATHFDLLVKHRVERNMDPAIDYRFKHPKKGYIWMRDARTIIYEKNKPVAIVGILHSVDSEKKSQDILTVKLSELEKLTKLMVGRELKMVELKKKAEKKY